MSASGSSAPSPMPATNRVTISQTASGLNAPSSENTEHPPSARLSRNAPSWPSLFGQLAHHQEKGEPRNMPMKVDASTGRAPPCFQLELVGEHAGEHPGQEDLVDVEEHAEADRDRGQPVRPRVIGNRSIRAATVGLVDAGSGAGAGVGTTGSLRPAVMAVPPRIDLMWSAAGRLCQQRYFPQFGQPVVLESGAHSPLPVPLPFPHQPAGRPAHRREQRERQHPHQLQLRGR